MSYSLVQSSGTGVQGAADDIYYLVRDTTNVTEPKYRYLCRITIDSVVIGTFKQLPNDSNSAVFLIQNIVNDYVKQDNDKFELGISDATKIFSTNTNAFKTVSVELGYEKATTINDAPVQTFVGSLNSTFKLINGTLRSQLKNSNQSNSAFKYQLSIATDQFLSAIKPIDSVYHQDVIEGQIGSMSFLNGDDISSFPSYLHVTYYTEAGVAINTGYFTNDTPQGGKAPAASLTDVQSLIYFGCFPKNLETQSIDTNLRPSNNTNWSYYDVQAANSTTLSGNQKSAKYRFHKLCDTRYNIIDGISTSEWSLHWWNEVGGIDNLILDGASQVQQSMKRTSYRTIGNNAFGAGIADGYSKPPQQGGKKAGKNLTTTTLTLNTREHNPDRLNYLIQSLVNSPTVFINMPVNLQQPLTDVNTAVVKCYVEDVQIKYNSSISDKISSYTITVEISRRKLTVI